MTMIAAIRTALTSLGYQVHDKRQEKMGTIDSTREVVVLPDDTSVEIETTLTYHVRSWINIEWLTTNPDNTHATIVKMVGDLEEAILDGSEPCKATFKFIQSETNQLGLMYKVIVTIEFIEVLNLD